MAESLSPDFDNAKVFVWKAPIGLRPEPNPATLRRKVAYAIEAHEVGAARVEISIPGRLLKLDEIRQLHARFSAR